MSDAYSIMETEQGYYKNNKINPHIHIIHTHKKTKIWVLYTTAVDLWGNVQLWCKISHVSWISDPRVRVGLGAQLHEGAQAGPVNKPLQLWQLNNFTFNMTTLTPE